MRIIVVAAKLELFFVTTPSSNTWWWDWGVPTSNDIKKGNILWNQCLKRFPIERNNKVSTFYLWLFLWFTETWNDNDFTQQTEQPRCHRLFVNSDCFPSTVTSEVTNENVSRYDRLLAHFLPGIGLISDLRQGGRRPSSSLEQRGVIATLITPCSWSSPS